jgi:branched-chain amino acid transport system substrate-binding protein
MIVMKKLNIKVGILFIGCMFLYSVSSYSQKEQNNYGNTPDDIVPYAHFQKAYKQHFMDPWPFRGVGRDKPEPIGLETVRIGMLAPLEDSKDVAIGKQMVNGATLAMELANQQGGYKGVPFELMAHNDVGLWGAAANEVVTMDDEGVWAILGSLNDIVTHVAIRVALKCEIVVVNMADPDPTLTETNIPWIIRVISDDRQSSYALANQIYRIDGHKRASLLRVNNRYGRVGTGEFKDASRRMGNPVAVELRFEDGHTDFTDQLNTIKRNNSDAVVLWGDATELGLIVNQMREMGMAQPVYACDRAVSPQFLELAGENANGIQTTCQYNPKADNPKYETFKAAYKERFYIDPDVFAVHSYDAMNMTIDAIRKAGLNRVLIRDVLTDMYTFQNYQGASGEIVFDASWNDVGQIYIAEINNNDFIFKPFSFRKEAVNGK